MENKFCALGCSPSKQLYIFPSRKYDGKRRKAWLDFFDMEEPNIEYIFACDRHFSHFQTTTKGIRAAAVPDVPIICNGVMLPFPRKSKDWRKNVVVVTPRDPEYTIYRHETGVFPQNLFNISESYRPVIQMPIIESISSSISTQTNTRFCGLVQISDIKEEYRLNCFYCCEMFDIEKWPQFLEHLKNNHFRKEEAFRMTKYLSHDHDYTSITLPSSSPLKSCYKTNMFTNTFIRLPPSQPMLVDPIILPPLLAKPEVNNGNQSKNLLNKSDTSPPLLAKPLLSNKEPFNINLADKLIKLLNETVLSPNFLHTEEDNILIIRNKASKSIETSNFLTNFMNSESSFVHANERSAFDVKLKRSTSSTLSSKYTRPIYTINYGQQDIPSRRYSLSRFLPPLPKNKKAKLVQKRIAQQTLKNIDVFENIYKTVKTRPPKLDESENRILKDFKNNKGDGRQILNPTPLSRCLKRIVSQNIEKKLKSTEIVFEYTPKNIIVTLLEAMKNYPVLWQFHDQPFNKMYSKAIEELCKKINERWYLNITLLKMRRSLNRILRFYRFMLPCESIDKFEEYFDKLALFLPTSLDEIPRARCAYCFICYKKDSELRKHIRVRHKALKWPYKCQNCLERFRESDEYELHKRLPHYEEIFKCDQCDKRFNRRNLFNKHVSSHERSKQRRIEAAKQKEQPPMDCMYICDVCNRQFKTQPELNRHKIFHNLTKFKCELCQKEYCSKMSLKLHLKRHRKELDFICEVCGKGFIRGVYLKAHMETHTGAKITCNICNLKLRKCSLSRHLKLVHIATEGTIESTFRAKSHRYKKFTTPKFGQIRNRSSETAPRRYNCKVCKINFDRLKELKDHNKQVHFDVERTPCRICNIEFIHLQNLKRHYRLKHKLHVYQIFKLVHQNEDLDTVLAIKPDELEAMTEFDFVTYSLNNLNNVRRSKSTENENYFEQGRIHSDKIQDEIMKAVENIDNEEIQVDDDHSMNDFFTDLLTHSYK